MRVLALSIAVALVAVAGPAHGEALPFKIIAHPDVPTSSVSKATLAQIFLRTRTRWDGGDKAKPVDQAATSPLKAAFAKLILDRDLDSLKAYWDQQVFSGKGVPPPEKPNDAAVAAYIASTPGAVGYIAATSRVEGLKTLELTGTQK
jgi:ABC-type phosphate transport system substrate-binding protein